MVMARQRVVMLTVAWGEYDLIMIRRECRVE